MKRNSSFKKSTAFALSALMLMGMLPTALASAKQADKGKYASGEYTVTANLYVPGELNTTLPGVTAYLTNPNNPLGLAEDNGEVETAIPNKPVTNNATLEVKSDGTQLLTLPVKNPVFTLQQIKDGKNTKIVDTVRNNITYTDAVGNAPHKGRITKLVVELKNDGGIYNFVDCIEFPTLLGEEWNVPLTMSVDFSNVKKNPDYSGEESSESSEESSSLPVESSKPSESSSFIESSVSEPSESSEPSEISEISSTSDGEKTTTVKVKHLKYGTYTVTCNIWFKKEDSRLPMNPHITSSIFPPKDPVENNATLVVDENGGAKVTIPISIQSKVMTIHTINGLNIVDSVKDNNGAYSSITVDLGVIENPNDAISKTCEIYLQMGDLAMSISGFEKDQTWPASFLLDLSSVPTVEIEKTITIGFDSSNGNAPKTGDSSNVAIYFAIAFLGVLTVFAVSMKRRKER